MGLVTGNDDDLIEKVDTPKHVNPINDEIVLSPKVEEHSVISTVLVENKRPWYDDLTDDMYTRSSTEVSGSRVYVEFISMITSPGSISSGDSSLISGAHREYVRIKNYPVYLDGGVSTSTDAKEQKTSTRSEAVIVGVLPPQTSDYFVLNTGYNRSSLMKIMSSVPLSIYKEMAYAIEYEMAEVECGDKYDEISSKVVRELTYIRENHQYGVKYLLTDKEIHEAMLSRMRESSLMRNYISEFYDTNLKVFALKTAAGFHTDMIIQKFLSQVTKVPSDLYTYPEYSETETLSTIFDALSMVDTSISWNMMDTVYYYHLYAPTDIAYLHPVLASPITSMPFQKASRMMNIREPNIVSSTVHSRGTCVLSEISISDIFNDVDPSGIPEFPNVLRNDTYLLSEKFYEGGYGNDLEELLSDVLDRRPVDRNRILKLVALLPMLESAERFFITPFVLLLLKVNEVK